MKKIISIIATLIMFCLLMFTVNVYAESLDSISVDTDKTTVRPGEEVKVTVQFGEELGAYTFDIAYDNNIFEYVSADGGTANDTTDKVRVVFYDSTGGTNPSTSMSVTFRAKSDITTSNPTEFTVTGEGLSNPDASVTYDDITTPIVKNVTVEPEYIDYTFKLEHSGEIIKNEEKEMKLSYSSPMGKYYEHARLIAEASTPMGATVKLLGTDESDLEHDIIQSGWGDAQGYKIGGKDVEQVLNVRANFSDAGEYKIILKLIDRDNSDSVIAEETFSFTVLETATIPEEPSEPIPEEPNGSTDTEQPTIPEKNETESTTPTEEIIEKVPETLPKTGVNIYMQILAYAIALVTLVFVIHKIRKMR